MFELNMLQNYLIVGAMVFSIGLIGFLARRNLIVMFLSAEMMLQGISISLIAWGRFHDDWGGQMLVIFVITIAACEAAIALALILMLFRRVQNIDMLAWNRLREENQPPFVDEEIPEETEPESVWPHLTPAGRRPQVDEEELLHRSRV